MMPWRSGSYRIALPFLVTGGFGSIIGAWYIACTKDTLSGEFAVLFLMSIFLFGIMMFLLDIVMYLEYKHKEAEMGARDQYPDARRGDPSEKKPERAGPCVKNRGRN